MFVPFDPVISLLSINSKEMIRKAAHGSRTKMYMYNMVHVHLYNNGTNVQ